MFPLHIAWSSPTIQLLMAILYVVLAGLVTSDVLLTISDVRGALGWIGAVWLAPIFGSLFYYLLGINRVTRRALKLGRLNEARACAPAPAEAQAAPNIELLCDVSEKITRCPLSGGNLLVPVSYTHLRAHETGRNLVCRLLLEK